jgi:ribonucleoside-diphosphate reductase alpha chain
MLSPNAEAVFRSRYAMTDTEDWGQLADRLSQHSGVPEIAQLVGERYFLPAGRILRNMGRPRGSLLNCYLIPIADDMNEIMEAQKNAAILWSEGGGVGINVSSLRPAGAPIVGKGGNSSGPVSFLKAFNAWSSVIETGGHRRAATTAFLRADHPDISSFLDAKLKHNELEYIELGVHINDSFLDAVESDKPWPQQFNQQVHGEVSARSLWQTILRNMLKAGEPGLQNMSNLRTNNSYYFAPIEGTNPCGEAPLSAYGCCDLGSINLAKMVTEGGSTKWSLLSQVIDTSVKFLDKILDLNRYVLPQIERVAHDTRRIGLGVMGLAEYLLRKQLRYGSPEALSHIEALFKHIRDAAYTASIRRSAELGAFPKFLPTEYSRAVFVRSLPASIRADIKKHGIRNVTLLSIAPTGTISLIPEVTGGIEPIMALAYKRQDRVSTRYYIHPAYRDALSREKGTEMDECLVDSYSTSIEDQLATQSAVQKYVDGGVSKTVNVPRSTTTSELSGHLLEYMRDLKGCTVYRDGSREGQPIVPISEKEARKHILSGMEVAVEQVKCKTGACEL